MLKLENSIRGLSFSRVAFDLTIQDTKGAVTKQPLKFKKLLVDYMKSTNNFFVFLSKKGPEGPFSLV